MTPSCIGLVRRARRGRTTSPDRIDIGLVRGPSHSFTKGGVGFVERHLVFSRPIILDHCGVPPMGSHDGVHRHCGRPVAAAGEGVSRVTASGVLLSSFTRGWLVVESSWPVSRNSCAAKGPQGGGNLASLGRHPGARGSRSSTLDPPVNFRAHFVAVKRLANSDCRNRAKKPMTSRRFSASCPEKTRLL